MKKQILSFTVVIALTGAIISGCSSQKNTGSSSDTTSKDTTKVSAPASTPDTVKKDTSMKTDTTHH